MVALVTMVAGSPTAYLALSLQPAAIRLEQGLKAEVIAWDDVTRVARDGDVVRLHCRDRQRPIEVWARSAADALMAELQERRAESGPPTGDREDMRRRLAALQAASTRDHAP